MTWKVKFGDLELEYVESWSPGIDPMKKIYTMYDGSTDVASFNKVRWRPKIVGICDETKITQIAEAAKKTQDTLQINTEEGIFEFENASIISVNMDYWRHANGTNYYRITMEFVVIG